MLGDAALDWWSLVHFTTGLALGFLPLSWRASAATMAVWELFEVVARQAHPGGAGAFEHEGWLNITVDLALGLAGLAVGALGTRAGRPAPGRRSSRI